MIAQGRGKIINIASMLSFQGGIRVPSYTASKSGIAGITRLLANEWASKGINVNAIAPGYMVTDNTAQLRADEDRSSADPRPHPGRALGRAVGPGRRRGVPGLVGIGLRPRRDHPRRRRLAGALTTGRTGAMRAMRFSVITVGRRPRLRHGSTGR